MEIMRQREIMDEKDRDIIMSWNLRREEREGERERRWDITCMREHEC